MDVEVDVLVEVELLDDELELLDVVVTVLVVMMSMHQPPLMSTAD